MNTDRKANGKMPLGMRECSQPYSYPIGVAKWLVFVAGWIKSAVGRSMTLAKISLPTLLCFLLIACNPTSERPRRTALVFGGGGARGAAEVGVLKYLEEVGVKVDCVAGTSMGAVIGSLYAAGYSAGEIEQLLLNEEWMWLFDREKLGEISSTRHLTGLLKGAYFREQMNKALAKKDGQFFHHIQRPFCCVGTILSRAGFEEVDFNKGSVADAVRISMAFPAPGNLLAYQDGKHMADGGIVNNLPVNVARDSLKADIIIAIDLEQGDCDFKIGVPTIGLLTRWFNTRPDVPRRLKNIDDADIYIHPNLKEYSIADYDRESLQQMIDSGYVAARRQHSELIRVMNIEH